MDPINQPSLLERIYSWENLLDAYHEAASEKWYRNDVTAFTANLEENLISIQNDLIWHTYKVGRYRQFYVHEPKKRLVMALGFRDRVVQWAIYLQTNQYLDNGMIYHSYGCRVGKRNHQSSRPASILVHTRGSKAGQMVLPETGRIKVFLPGGSPGTARHTPPEVLERGRLPLAYGNDYKLRPYALRTASGKVRRRDPTV